MIDVGKVGNPVLAAGNVEDDLKFTGFPERGTHGDNLVVEATHLASRPIGFTQSPDLDTGSRLLTRENLGAASLDDDWRFVQVRLHDEVVPVDVDHALIRIRRPRNKGDMVAELVNGEAT